MCPSVLQNSVYEAGRFGVTGHNYQELQAEDESLTRKEFIDRHIRRQMGPWLSNDNQISIGISEMALDGDPTLADEILDYGGSDSIVYL